MFRIFVFAGACLLALALLLPSMQADASVAGRFVDYKQRHVTLQGYLAEDDAAPGARPGVVVFADYFGVTDYAEARAVKLAKLGYVVFVADVYGKGIHPKTPQEAGAQTRTLRQDPALLQTRSDAALAQLRSDPHVAPSKLVAMGYCFGAQPALGLGRHGADLAAIVIFHGDLRNPDPADAKNIKGHVLVFWGADDPHFPATAMDAFEDEMRATSVDWQVVTFSHTVHSFTVPSADNYAGGDAYNPVADARSWQDMRDFLHDVLR